MKKLSKQYYLIERYFKSTTEFYDNLEWEGKMLLVFYKNEIIEKYSKKDLKEMINGF